MKIFMIANHLPSSRHEMAATMVLYHAVAELRAAGHEVVIQTIYQMEDRRALTEDELALIEALKAAGVELTPVLFRSDYANRRPKNALDLAHLAYQRLFQPMERFYSALNLRPLISERVRQSGANVLVIFWNGEGLAATYQDRLIPKFVYYGVPDHFPGLARLADPELFGLKISPLRLAARQRSLRMLEKGHLKLMMDCPVVANVCAAHANYYAQRGHPRSLYLQNMWPENSSANFRTPSRPTNGKPKIVGSVGTLNSTGNAFGVKFIAQELVPRLSAALGPEGYEVHIYGPGQPTATVAKLLQAPSVRLRGWVEDIDAEIRSADVFLVANNTGPYKGSHTRFLHAWSLGACCVAHEYNVQANPEMRHMDNVLLGKTADEMVQLLLRVLREPALRARVGEGGWRTHRAHFTPRVVVGRMLAELEALVAARPP